MNNTETDTAAAGQGFLGRPKVFWITAVSLLGMAFFSLPDWISTNLSPNRMIGDVFVRDIPVRFGFFDLFSNFGQTGLYYLLGESMSKYNAIKYVSFVTLGLLALSLALIVISLISHNSKSFLRFAISGFGIGSLASLLFMLTTIIMTGEILQSGLTLLPIAVFVIPLVTVPFLLDPVTVKSKRLSRFLHQKAFFFMIIPVMVYVFIFSYLPLQGWQMAFQNFQPQFEEQPWVGFFQFEMLFTSGSFWRIMQNTLGMSIINLVLSFSTAIFFALMINELRQKMFKRVVQTISYLPHFLSWVIAAAMIGQFLASDGILNDLLVGLGIFKEPKIFLADVDNFWWIIGWSGVWKSVGWNTIIYLAAITSIDPELYESAELDGAGRFAKMWNITLPGIKSTILVLLIMSIGWILSAGYEVQYLLGNDLVWDKAETIDVFVIRNGIRLRNYSLATALGMFKTVVSVILIAGANQLSKRFAQESLV